MSTRERVESFCTRFGLKRPILLAPMAGASAPQLSIAVAHAGGLGACGVLLMSPEEITTWCREVRSHGGGAFQLNAWVPDVAPLRNEPHEAEVRAFLSSWGPPVPATAGNARPPDFEQQCQAMLAAHPPVISSAGLGGTGRSDGTRAARGTGHRAAVAGGSTAAGYAVAARVASAAEALRDRQSDHEGLERMLVNIGAPVGV
jgi:NAD(P)H-dependent flavin oxidoreductase YrpB (nitropropane dioxygenase family)